MSQLQHRSWASRAIVQQVCFENRQLQCLRDVPQRLNVLSTLIVIGLMQIDGHKCTVFNVSAFYVAFLWTCASSRRPHRRALPEARPEEGLIEGRNVEDSPLVSIYLHETYRN